MKILSFLPHAGLWKLKFPRSIILESLKKNGHEVHEVKCMEALNDYCIVMMSKVPHKNSNLFSSEEKREICNDCMNKSNILSKEFRFIDLNIKKITKEQNEIINFELSKINQKNFLNYKYNSINIGKYCMSEMILMTKKKSFNFNKNEWDDYLYNIKNSIITIDFFEDLLKKKKYDIMLTNNGFYSYMRAAQEVAKKYQLRNLDINHNRNFHKQMNSFLISKRNDVVAYKEMMKKWADFKKFPLNHDQMNSTTKHLNLLISGGSNNEFIDNKSDDYNFDIRNFFNIKKEKKIILVCTSSEDEILSYEFMEEKISEEKILFETQVDWIKNIIEYAKKNDDFHFIIRIHPREYKNYSHSSSSEMYEELLEMLKNSPENVSINLPSQKISIFQAAENVDLILNSWSSVGKDLALMGLPVITYGKKNLFYPIDLNIPLISDEIDDYFKLIRQSINIGWDYKRIINAYRWCHLEFDYSSVNLEDSIYIKNLKKTKKKLMLKIIDYLKTLFDKNFHLTKHIDKRPKVLQEEKTLNSLIVNNESIYSIKKTKNYFNTKEDDELKFIKIEIKKLIDILYKSRKKRIEFGLSSKLKNFVEN